MKNKIWLYTLIVIAAIGLLNLSGCKRSEVNDPGVIGPAGFRVIVTGTANPSTLYIPESNPEVTSYVKAKVLNNNGTPVVGKTLIFESGGIGYFRSLIDQHAMYSDTRVTDANGEASITFYVTRTAYVTMTTVTNISITLSDDGRLDNTNLSNASDTVPISIVPSDQLGLILSGRVMISGDKGVEGVVIQLTGTDGNASGTVMTDSNGSYGFYVAPGWYGKLEAKSDALKFAPASYEYIAAVPVTYSRFDLDFFVVPEPQLAVDKQVIDIGGLGGQVNIYVYNNGSADSIPFVITPQDSWITATPDKGTTPVSFEATIDPNTTTSSRTGKIVITATSNKVVNKTLEITVNQTAGPTLALSPSEIVVSSNSSGTVKTILVINPSSSDVITWKLKNDTSWLQESPQGASSGSVTGSTFTVTIQTDNTETYDRIGYITVQAVDPNDSYRELTGLTAILKVTQRGTSSRVPNN